MADAPLASTIVALALIPVAFFFVHAYLSGRKGLPHHRLTGTIAVVWDLTLSIGYMLYRTFGGEVEGSSLEIEGLVLVYFMVHGIVAVIVMALEAIALLTGVMTMRGRDMSRLHRRLSPYLLVLWFCAFLSGEAVYIVSYML